MSYDVYLSINTGINDTIIVECGNYTSNVWKIYKEAFPTNGIHDINSLLAKDAAPIIKQAIDSMNTNPSHYKDLGPSNGWGNFNGALAYLQTIYLACIEHPACTVLVDA